MQQTPHAPRPLLGLAICLGAGAFAGGDVPVSAVPALLGLSGLALALGVVGPASRLAVAALAAAALGIGAAGHAVEQEAYERSSLRRFVVDEDPDAPVLVFGTAAADSRRADDRVQLLVDVDSLRWRGRTRAIVGRARIGVGDPAHRLEVAQGERLSIWTTLRAPRGYDTPGAFDVAADARRRGVHAHGFCKSVALVSRGSAADAGGLAARIAVWRRAARRVIVDSLPAGDEEGLVRAMVLGDREGLSADASEAFRIAGTYHVLAISGAQVGLLAAMVVLLLRRLRVAPLAAALTLTAVVWLYTLFVGADPPVTRAALMAVCLGLGRAFDLDGELVNVLGFAAGALLAWQPSAILDVSFQLSFGATLGILLLVRPVAALLPALPLQLELVIAVSIAAQAALLPLLAGQFHRLAPAALVLNLAAGPLSAAVLVSGFALLLVHALLPPLTGFAADVAWVFAHGLLRSGEVVRALPGLDVHVPTPSALVVLVYFLGLAQFAHGRRRIGSLVLALAVAALVIGPGVRADGRLRLSVLDVGNGDALVVTSPSGRVLLVDAAGATRSFDLGEAVVGPFLWTIGARSLDFMALTHVDGDHVGGAPFLLRAFAVGQAWEGVAPYRDGRYDRLSRVLAAVPRASLRAGSRLAWDGVMVEALGPPPPPRVPPQSRNDHSLVLRLRYRAVSLLLMADAQRDEEAALPLRPADVLKVGHHGSATSTGKAMLAAVRPRLALISVGAQNAFGHPHPQVLARLAASGATTLRTDRDGTITLSTDGARIWLETPPH